MTLTLSAVFVKTIYNISTMQEMTSAICEATTTPLTTATSATNIHTLDKNLVPEVTLKDTRDNNTYRIRKLADGNCWMTENLRLSFTESTILTPSTSDMASNWQPGTATETEETKTQWSASHYPTLVEEIDTVHSYYDKDAISTTADGEDQYRGVYYNWYTATATSGNHSTSISDPDAPYSVCPKNWMIPSYEKNLSRSWKNLFWNIYNIKNGESASIAARSFPFSFVMSGGYDARQAKITNTLDRVYIWESSGAYLSSGETFPRNYYLLISPNSIEPQNQFLKNFGRPVRCVAR